MRRWAFHGAVALIAALCVVSCARSPRPAPTSAPSVEMPPAENPALLALWNERRATRVAALPLGAGDRLRISVPGLPEFSPLETVVGADGNLSLPLIGPLPAEGRSDAELTQDLERALEQYMYDPRVSVVVLDAASRMVGVIGAVAKPGYYPMRDAMDSVLDLVAAAGGLSAKASTTLQLIPSGSGASAPLAPGSETDSELVAIDLSASAPGTAALYATLPVRPGDVLIATERGQVLVTGWVEAPGAYPISPGMTVLAAVSAAGGTQYPADRNVHVARNSSGGNKHQLKIDLEAVEEGRAIDLPVADGDVIHVSSTAPKAAGWGLYQLVTSLLSIGL